ncbi:hypothetical protein [Neptunicella marina]|uniref:Flagellar basal-body/hook protein C-terminal domain-containing protein n=1 Tax=Neptunicella marina TaxID=2125989 RepID=A0A8J6IUL7_9ALTE|nr:hypothetical protein [Neptunicella marina]MBC3765933.1 hypothetical protein [Neptunicella marina]
MAMNVDNNVNSALLSGVFGLQQASNGITQTSTDIAIKTAQQRDTQDVLADAARQQLKLPGNLINSLQGQDSVTSDLVSLQTNLRYAQASAKVIGVADNMIGRLIDDIA